jgi:hypothetical protein
MGCGACRIILEETYDMPLDFNLLPIQGGGGLEKLNSLYNRASHVLRMIELMRDSTVDKLDELILASGACVFACPDISSCIKCILWNISSNFDGNINKAEIKFLEDEPYMIIQADIDDTKNNNYFPNQETKSNKIRPNLKYIISLLINYISEIFALKNQIKKIEEKIPELIYIISENNENYLLGQNFNDLEEYREINVSHSLKNDAKFRNIVYHNNLKIKKALNLFQDLTNTRKNIIEKINFEFKSFKKNNGYLIKIDKVGIEAYAKGIEDFYEVAFLSKNILLDEVKPDSKKEFSKIYLNSINEGKNKYLNLIENKKHIKSKMNYDIE